MALELNGTTGVSLIQNGVVTTADLAFTPGKVLQVITGSLTSDVTITATSPTDVGLSVSITPSSTSSRILIIATVFISTFNSDQSMQSGWTVTDSSNNAIISSSGSGTNPYDIGSYMTTTNYVIHTVQTKHTVHSPNTTSSFTYKLRAENDTADSIVFNSTGGNGSTITLMEIAA